MITFYQSVESGARRPEDTATEDDRLLSDDLLFPHYKREIRFAALSLDGLGPASYGTCSLVIREVAIRERATVFEENSLYFCGDRGLGVGRPVPLGYRAVWDERDQLATAKLESLLKSGMQPREFTGILLRTSGKTIREEFVEVHIYGPLHRQSIERLVVRQPKRPAERAILKEIERKLKTASVGATVDIIK